MKTYLSRNRRYRRYYIAAKGKKAAAILRNAVKEFLTDNCLHLAASVSYYMLFSIFLLSLAFISVMGFVWGSPESEIKVIDAIYDFLPISSEFITSSIQRVVRERGALGAVAIVGLLWSGSAVFNVIRKSLNVAWGVKKPRPFLVERAMELGMTLGVGLLLITSIGITTAIGVIRRFNAAVVGLEFLDEAFFWQVSLTLLSISLAFMTFLILYKFVPNTRVRWRDVWGGALLAAVGFEVTKQIFVWYATNHAHHHLIFGPVAPIIALLIWTYISAVIVLFCAKLTSAYSRPWQASVEFSTWKSRRRTNNHLRDPDRLAVGGTKVNRIQDTTLHSYHHNE